MSVRVIFVLTDCNFKIISKMSLVRAMQDGYSITYLSELLKLQAYDFVATPTLTDYVDHLQKRKIKIYKSPFF